MTVKDFIVDGRQTLCKDKNRAQILNKFTNCLLIIKYLASNYVLQGVSRFKLPETFAGNIRVGVTFICFLTQRDLLAIFIYTLVLSSYSCLSF